MAIRNIVLEGDALLRKKSRPVDAFDERLAILLDDMAETMYANDGVGLAAPQVGILKRVCVVDTGEGLTELVNPSVVAKSGRQQTAEGCLSCPGEYGITVRPMQVSVKAKNRFGDDIMLTAEGLQAKAFCHEIDHLDGVLFKDCVVKMVHKDGKQNN